LCAIIEDLKRTVEELKVRLDGLREPLMHDGGNPVLHESANDCELGIHKG